jgi:spore coat polysaccharide biosynthesis predicted glycosyltransferase SpsG
MIVFRTDASQNTGFGRLVRSTYLASLLRSKTDDVLFCVKKDKAVGRFLDERGWTFCWLKEFNRLKNLPLKGAVFDVSDFTDEDHRLIKRARANPTHSLKTVQFIEPGVTRQDVDYVIDASVQPPQPGGEDNPGAVLHGPGYAVLHTRFRHFNQIKRKYRRSVKYVLVCLGGCVSYRLLRKTVDVLSRYRFDVKVAPGMYLKKSSQKILRRIYPDVRFVGDTDNLARAFYEADAAVVTPGNAAYEAAAAGTPALYFFHRKEQKPEAGAFQQKGVGLAIASVDELPKINLSDIIADLSLEKRIEMGEKGKQLVDAKGVYRLLDFFQGAGLFNASGGPHAGAPTKGVR